MKYMINGGNILLVFILIGFAAALMISKSSLSTEVESWCRQHTTCEDSACCIEAQEFRNGE